MRARAVALALLVAAWLSSRALAYHTKETPLLTDHAYTLEQGELQMGLWRFELGVHRAVMLSTITLPWLLGVSNVTLKTRLYQGEKWAFALEPSAYQLDLARLARLKGDSKADLWVLPVELVATRNFHDEYVWSFGAVYTHVAVVGSYDKQDFDGVVAVSNAQLTSTFEWRTSKVAALVLHYRLLMFQNLAASVRTDLELDRYTTAKIRASAKSSVFDVANGSSLALSCVFSFQTFNLRVGAGYGNYSLPAVNLVLPERTFFPELDFWWRF